MADEIFKKIAADIDVKRLLAETKTLLSMTTWHPDDSQISLQHRKGDEENPWHSGVGTIGEWQGDEWVPYFDERDFNILNPQLENTYFAQVLRSMPFKPVRSRLMKMPPKKCYSIHVDETNRYHLALQTNYHARFIFTKAERIYHIPADGNIYWVDTIQEHTAINGGKEDRIHLVMLPA